MVEDNVTFISCAIGLWVVVSKPLFKLVVIHSDFVPFYTSRLGGEGGSAFSCDVLIFGLGGSLQWRTLVAFLLIAIRLWADGTLRTEWVLLDWASLHYLGRQVFSVRFSKAMLRQMASDFLLFIPLENPLLLWSPKKKKQMTHLLLAYLSSHDVSKPCLIKTLRVVELLCGRGHWHVGLVSLREAGSSHWWVSTSMSTFAMMTGKGPPTSSGMHVVSDHPRLHWRERRTSWWWSSTAKEKVWVGGPWLSGSSSSTLVAVKENQSPNLLVRTWSTPWSSSSMSWEQALIWTLFCHHWWQVEFRGSLVIVSPESKQGLCLWRNWRLSRTRSMTFPTWWTAIWWAAFFMQYTPGADGQTFTASTRLSSTWLTPRMASLALWKSGHVSTRQVEQKRRRRCSCPSWRRLQVWLRGRGH